MGMRASGSPPERVADETPVPDEWVRALSAGGAERERATARLHEMLLRVARAEARRRSGQLRISGPELDDLAHQAAADAVLAIIAKIGQFRGESRFTTWAYKFVIFEVSGKIGRHFWRHPAVPLEAGTGTGCRTGSAWTRPGSPSGATWSGRCGGRSRRSSPSTSGGSSPRSGWTACRWMRWSRSWDPAGMPCTRRCSTHDVSCGPASSLTDTCTRTR